MANQVVQCEVKEGIGIITLNRPEKRNAINDEVLESIHKAFTDLSENVAVKIILSRGPGLFFRPASILIFWLPSPGTTAEPRESASARGSTTSTRY